MRSSLLGKSECWVGNGSLEAISDADMNAPGGVAFAMISNKLRSMAALRTAGYTRFVTSRIAERQAPSSVCSEEVLKRLLSLVEYESPIFASFSSINFFWLMDLALLTCLSLACFFYRQNLLATRTLLCYFGACSHNRGVLIILIPPPFELL